MDVTELKTNPLVGNVKMYYYESLLRKFLELKVNNPTKHKDKICQELGVSQNVMNNILRDTGNGNMIRPHKVKKSSFISRRSQDVESNSNDTKKSRDGSNSAKSRSKSRGADSRSTLHGGSVTDEIDKEQVVRFMTQK